MRTADNFATGFSPTTRKVIAAQSHFLRIGGYRQRADAAMCVHSQTQPGTGVSATSNQRGRLATGADAPVTRGYATKCFFPSHAEYVLTDSGMAAAASQVTRRN